MCVNKLYIRNNKLDFNANFDSPYNYVPCGKCEECQRNKAIQYEIRSIAEYEYTKRNGGSSYYYTLTYNEENVPRLFDTRVFSKRHCQLLFKRMRKHLFTAGLNTNFRYFLSSEYGHKTLRPHYHVVFFFPFEVSPVFVYNMLKSAWNYGHIFPGHHLGLIKDVRPFQYVSKYVQKDLYSFKEIEKKRINPDDLLFYRQNKHTFFNEFDILPFHLQSCGFGSSLLDNLSVNDYINGFFVRTDSLGISRRVPVPLYILRKKYYEPYINNNGNISYVLTSDGLEIMRKRLYKQYDYYVDLYKSALDYLKANSIKVTLLTKTFGNYENFYSRFSSQWSLIPGLVASFNLLWSRNHYVSWTFQNFRDDVDIYIQHIKDLPFLPFLPIAEFNDRFITLSDVDTKLLFLLRYILDETISLMKYDLYLQNVRAYNIKQYRISEHSKKVKLAFVKSFNEFKNFKFHSICLNTLTNRLKQAS